MRFVLKRWLTFYAVGGIGILVQLGALALLTYSVHCDPVLATAIAVETAVINNFIWHRRWTWADRADTATCRRFLRFQVTNGLFPLLGNSVLTTLFSDWLQCPLLVANLAAIAVCSVFTFVAGDRLVFANTD